MDRLYSDELGIIEYLDLCSGLSRRRMLRMDKDEIIMLLCSNYPSVFLEFLDEFLFVLFSPRDYSAEYKVDSILLHKIGVRKCKEFNSEFFAQWRIDILWILKSESRYPHITDNYRFMYKNFLFAGAKKTRIFSIYRTFIVLQEHPKIHQRRKRGQRSEPESVCLPYSPEISCDD